VELQSQRGDHIPTGNAGDVNDAVNGAPAIINQRTFPGQAGASQFTIVFYLWPQGELLHSFSVRLDQGITRAMADDMAASVR
jgi:hypothetical protein